MGSAAGAGPPGAACEALRRPGLGADGRRFGFAAPPRRACAAGAAAGGQDGADAVGAAIELAASWISGARALLVGSGAGMSVDSGLGTYRGCNAGVWPPLEALGLDYSEVCTPELLTERPRLAWAFWRYSCEAYRAAAPHEGYHIVQRWGQRARHGCFAYTTNVDALWPRALAPERVYEAHGSAAFLQHGLSPLGGGEGPPAPCPHRAEVWPCPPDLAERMPLEPGREDAVEEASLPRCHACGAVARPNVLMFGEIGTWRRDRAREQKERYRSWLKAAQEVGPTDATPLVCLEIGAGRAIPTVRSTLEAAAAASGGRLVRVNLEDSEPPPALEAAGRAVGIPLGALEALRRIDALVAG